MATLRTRRRSPKSIKRGAPSFSLTVALYKGSGITVHRSNLRGSQILDTIRQQGILTVPSRSSDFQPFVYRGTTNRSCLDSSPNLRNNSPIQRTRDETLSGAVSFQVDSTQRCHRRFVEDDQRIEVGSFSLLNVSNWKRIRDVNAMMRRLEFRGINKYLTIDKVNVMIR